MQYQPSAEDLLAAIAELLDEEMLAALPDALKHKCRVAANLARILEREAALGPAAATRERARLAVLAGPDGGDDAVELSRLVAQRIRTGDDAGFQHRAWDALVAICRDDLAIAKPGHDAWEGP